MPAYQVDRVRRRFAALRAGEVRYLDNAAGAQLPDRVIDAVGEALAALQVNVGAAYAPSRRVTAHKEAVRARTAAFLGAEGPGNVAFGPNATTLVTLLARSVGDALTAGDEIVVTSLDHHANVDPWRALAARGVVVRTWRPRAPFGTLHADDLRELLGPRTRLVAFTAASNALGTRPPVAESAAVARDAGAWVMVDLVHAAPHELPDVAGMGIDMAVFSPYKVFAPHLGVLYLGPKVRDRLTPPKLAFHAADAPNAWEPGTQSQEAIIGWGAALDHLVEIGSEVDEAAAGDERAAWRAAYAAIAAHEDALCGRILRGLDALGYERYGLPGVEERTATVAFNHPERPPGVVAAALADAGVAVAAGHFYAFDLVMRELGLVERGGAVRASAVHYTDAADVDALLEALARL
ncbi:MAG: cysteine desulfurase-like protein [Trueperaceae bacterium]|nr:cysteine desulfurase-like protein [Trueperaceae bacterium]